MRLRPLLVLVPLLLTGPAAAGPGALEIHQSCVATGCFPGDDPGFPVEIAASGSYVLTSNLQVPDESTTAILVESDDVSIDLGGFTISGVTVCSGTPPTCTPQGFGHGVSDVPSAPFQRTRVSNGIVRGMGGSGVRVGSDSSVERVIAASNGSRGIVAGPNGTIVGCKADHNSGSGISTDGASLISRSTALGNGNVGIICQGPCNVVHSTARENVLGIVLTNEGGMVLGCTIADNANAGLTVPTAGGYGQNVLIGNATGSAATQVQGGGIQIGGNACAGMPCP